MATLTHLFEHQIKTMSFSWKATCNFIILHQLCFMDV